MSHSGPQPLDGPIHRNELRDTTCPNYTASFQNIFDLQSNWITSRFTITAKTAVSPLRYFDLALSYSDDGGNTYVPKVQTTAVLDVTNKITNYQGSLIDATRDLRKGIEGACIGYAATLSDKEPCSFWDDFSYEPPQATVLGEISQTSYVEIKNRSKRDSLQAITLVFLDATDQGNQKKVVLTDRVLPGKSFRFDFAKYGLNSRVTLFHFEWMYQGNTVLSEPVSPRPGSYFSWIKASAIPDASLFSFIAAQVPL